MKRRIGTLVFTIVLAGTTTLYAQDGGVSSTDSINETSKVTTNDEREKAIEKVSVVGKEATLDFAIEYVDGVAYIPLRDVAETLGYTVTWNHETRSVDLQEGALWTSVILEKNRYFKYRMAPWELSGAPILINGETYVPVEFFSDILNVAQSVNEGRLTIDTSEVEIERGYVKSITYDETGTMTLVITDNIESTEGTEVMVKTDASQTIVQKEIHEGDYISVITSPYILTVYPKTISAYIIY